jgi:hypothetical protein
MMNLYDFMIESLFIFLKKPNIAAVYNKYTRIGFGSIEIARRQNGPLGESIFVAGELNSE